MQLPFSGQSCQDYLATAFPGIKEPVVECGRTAYDKVIKAGQVWLEFVSDGINSDPYDGFGLRYYTKLKGKRGELSEKSKLL